MKTIKKVLGVKVVLVVLSLTLNCRPANAQFFTEFGNFIITFSGSITTGTATAPGECPTGNGTINRSQDWLALYLHHNGQYYTRSILNFSVNYWYNKILGTYPPLAFVSDVLQINDCENPNLGLIVNIQAPHESDELRIKIFKRDLNSNNSWNLVKCEVMENDRHCMPSDEPNTTLVHVTDFLYSYPIAWEDAEYKVEVRFGHPNNLNCSGSNGTSFDNLDKTQYNNIFKVDIPNSQNNATLSGFSEGMPMKELCDGGDFILESNYSCGDQYAYEIYNSNANGDQLGLVAQSGTILGNIPTSINLSQVFNPVAGNYYKVKFRAGNPFADKEFFIYYKAYLNPIISVSPQKTPCYGESMTMTLIDPPSSFTWHSTSDVTPVGVTSVINPTVTGTYSITTNEACVNLPAPFNMSVFPQTQIDLSHNDDVHCAEGPLPLLNLTANTSHPGGSGIWSINTGTIAANGTFDPTQNTLPGTFIATYTYTDPNGCVESEDFSFTYFSSSTFVPTVINGSCAGAQDGEIYAVASGYPPYSYKVNNVAQNQPFTNLSPGLFNIELTDGHGCTSQQTISVSEPAQVTASLNQSSPLNLDCWNSQALVQVVNAQGGDGNYQYDFGSGFTSTNHATLPAQSSAYSIQVKDGNGCLLASPLSLQVTAPTALSSSLQVNPATCLGIANGSIGLQVSGGTPGYAYQWSNGQTTANLNGLAGGNYQVTVSDANGCTLSEVVSVANQPYSIGMAPSITDAGCMGAMDGSVVIQPTIPSTPYTYNWAHGASNSGTSGSQQVNLTSGNYQVTITDLNTGCQQIHNYSVGENTTTLWPGYSQGSDFTETHDVESDGNGNIYVHGTFTTTADFNFEQVNIGSGSANTGMYLAKYLPCGSMEWIAYTKSGQAIDVRGVDIEFRDNLAMVLFESSDMGAAFDLVVVDKTGKVIAQQNGISGTNPGASGYYAGLLEPAGSGLIQVGAIIDNLLNQEELEAIERKPGFSPVSAMIIGGRNNQQNLLLAEINWNGNSYSINQGNSLIDQGGSPDNHLFDMEVIPGLDKLAIGGQYRSSNPLGTGLSTAFAAHDAFIAVYDPMNLGAGAIAAHRAGSDEKALVREIDVRQISSSSAEIYLTGDFTGKLTSWNYASASGAGTIGGSGSDNAVVGQASFNQNAATLTFDWGVDFRGDGLASARGTGIIYDYAEGRILSVGTFKANELNVTGQTDLISGNNRVNLWQLAIDNGTVEWINGATSAQDITVAGIAADGGNGFMAGTFLENLDFIHSAAGASLLHPNSGTSEMWLIRGGNAYASQGQIYREAVEENSAQTVQVFNLFPNPAKDFFVISFSEELTANSVVEVFSATGQLVLQQPINSSTGQQKVSTLGFAPGIYLVKVQTGKTASTQRLVVE